MPAINTDAEWIINPATIHSLNINKDNAYKKETVMVITKLIVTGDFIPR